MSAYFETSEKKTPLIQTRFLKIYFPIHKQGVGKFALNLNNILNNRSLEYQVYTGNNARCLSKSIQ